MRMLIMIVLVAMAGCVSTPVRDTHYACYVYDGGTRASSCVDMPGWTLTQARRLCDMIGELHTDEPCFEIGTVARCTVTPVGGEFVGLTLVESYYLPWTTNDALGVCESVGGYFEVNP